MFQHGHSLTGLTLFTFTGHCYLTTSKKFRMAETDKQIVIVIMVETIVMICYKTSSVLGELRAKLPERYWGRQRHFQA